MRHAVYTQARQKIVKYKGSKKSMEDVQIMIKVGINGFGRIGRFVFRAAQERNDIQIVGINDLCPVDYLAYMLKYDTMHGKFEGTVEADVENNQLIVNGKKIHGGLKLYD